MGAVGLNDIKTERAKNWNQLLPGQDEIILETALTAAFTGGELPRN